ncbi:hypothetical protein KUCAC02_033077 [Chaenocephalus aceratus]|nr:hypothetical protein KUCAC02_033077 [Chaenocephalus aceratus]
MSYLGAACLGSTPPRPRHEETWNLFTRERDRCHLQRERPGYERVYLKASVHVHDCFQHLGVRTEHPVDDESVHVDHCADCTQVGLFTGFQCQESTFLVPTHTGQIPEYQPHVLKSVTLRPRQIYLCVGLGFYLAARLSERNPSLVDHESRKAQSAFQLLASFIPGKWGTLLSGKIRSMEDATLSYPPTGVRWYR